MNDHYCKTPSWLSPRSRDGKTWHCNKCRAVYTYRAHLRGWLLTKDGKR